MVTEEIKPEILVDFFPDLSRLKTTTLIPMFQVIIEAFIHALFNGNRGIATIEMKLDKWASQGTFCSDSGVYTERLVGKTVWQVAGQMIEIIPRNKNMDESGDIVFSMYSQIDISGEEGAINTVFEVFKDTARSRPLAEWWLMASNMVNQADRDLFEFNYEINGFYQYKRGRALKWRDDPFGKKWWYPLANVVDFLLYHAIGLAWFLFLAIALAWWVPILIITGNDWFWLGIISSILFAGYWWQ
jgi:hypothetical protein